MTLAQLGRPAQAVELSARAGTSDEEFSSAADWVARCQDGRF
ncbi:hypothetical protein [Streptomyces sp. NPDC000851]